MNRNNFTLKRIEGSFRDPLGYVYQSGDKIYRTIRASAAQDYITLRDADIYQKLIQSEKLVFSKEVSLIDFECFDPEVKYVIEHEKLPLITYSYEWPFNALKAAALFHLELQLALLDINVTLSDANAYNIQFIGAKPIFIDFLSFRPYREGEYWVGHKQFSEHFLFPLLIQVFRGVTYHAWLRGTGEGISLEDIVSILPFRSKLKPQVIMHLLLPLMLKKRAKNKTERNGASNITYPPLLKRSYKNILAQLHKWICSLAISKNKHTTWDNYTRFSSYTHAESDAKVEFVTRFVRKTRPKILLDLGCNRGEFSELALAHGVQSVVGIDSDPQACDLAFTRAHTKKLPLNILQVDMTNPSPAQGWRGKEMQALNTRLQADNMIALAVLHHFVIGKNISLSSAVDYLIGLAPQGIIEFVDKTDEQVVKMLRFREDIFLDYSKDNFLGAISTYANIIEIKEIKASRILVWYKRYR